MTALHRNRWPLSVGITGRFASDSASDGGREYSADAFDADPLLFLTMAIRFMRANEESALKGTRVAKAHSNRRAQFASDAPLHKPYTRKLPGWIRWNDDTKAYELIENRTAMLREIFAKAEQGWGTMKIAAWLNESGEETWGAGGWKAGYWHKSYVRKLLSNPAAIGVFVPHRVTPSKQGGAKKVRTPLDPIAHRYPAAIDKETFERIANRLSTTEARGRNVGAPKRNIFAGVLKCRHCGGTVTRVTKGKWVYLVCAAANAKAGTCKYESLPYHEATEALCDNIGHTIEHAPRGASTADVEQCIDKLQVELDVADHAARELLELVIAEKSAAARRALREAEQERDALAQRLREQRARRETLTSANVGSRLAALRQALLQAPVDVEGANKALRAAVKKMVIEAAEGTLEIWWHHADQPQEVVFVTSRKRRDINSIEDARGE